MSSLVKLLFLHEVRGSIPSQIKLTDCSLKYERSQTKPGLITGVYGTSSKQLALESLARWNSRNAMTQEEQEAGAVGSKLLMIDANYIVEDLDVIRQRVSAQTVQESGWLNMDRLVPALRDTLHDMWIKWISHDEGSRKALELKDESLLKLVREYPQYVNNLMFSPQMRGVVHPVRPTFAPDTTLWGATVRSDGSNFEKAECRLGSVKVTL